MARYKVIISLVYLYKLCYDELYYDKLYYDKLYYDVDAFIQLTCT